MGIFITDLDGTLLRGDQTISQYTVELLTEAIGAGHLITYATARSLSSSMRVVQHVPWKHPVILYNGALVYDVVQEQVIDGYWLPSQLGNEILVIAKQYGLSPFHFCLVGHSQERVYYEPIKSYGMQQFYNSRPNDPRFFEVEKLSIAEGHKTLELAFIGELEQLLPLKLEVEQRFSGQVNVHMMQDYYIANHYFLEFGHPQASKYEGVNLWAKHMGVDPADIHVFGDHLNDVGLFQAGGKRIAVSNAQDQLLQLADVIIDSNNDDGVAKYIAKTIGLPESFNNTKASEG